MCVSYVCHNVITFTKKIIEFYLCIEMLPAKM